MEANWIDRVVLVTGGSGFVGANLIGRLLAEGAEVVCLERDRTSPNSLDVLGLRQRTTVVSGSVEQLDLVERILNEYSPDFIFHLAAQAIVGPANNSPFSTFEANVRGTYVLLEAARRAVQVPSIVVASSDKAYGSQSTLPYTEDLPLNGIFPYDVSKACADLIARSFARTYNMPIAVTRSANIYGPADLNFSRIIPGTIASLFKGEAPVIRSDGTPVREFIHVDDVVDGYLTIAMNMNAVKGEAFNFGTNEPVKIVDLVGKIIHLAGRDGKIEPNILLSTKIQREIDEQYLSGAKISEVLNWKPLISLDDGLRSTIDWYRANSTTAT